MKVVTIIQARTTSTRLPNKVLLDIFGKPLLERVIDQARKIKNTDELWVATSTHENDDLIELLCERKGVACYRGSLEDVRGRYYQIAVNRQANLVVRITADNPFTEPEYAEELITFLKKNSNTYDFARMNKSTVLDGTYSEVFTMKSLVESVENYNDERNKEHVTPAIYENMRMHELISVNEDLVAKKPYFIGVDTFEDLKKATLLYKKFGEQDTLKKIINETNEYGKAV